MATYPTDIHPGTTATPGGFRATGYTASQPGDALNVNPAPGINWLDKYGEMDWGNALKTGDFGLTDAERASQLAGVIRFNNEEMAKAQAARAAEQAAISQPIQGPGRMPTQMMGGTYPYQIPNRDFTWQTTPQEQMALAGRMNRQDLQPLLGSGEYGPLAGQQYRYTPQGTTQINYGPGGGSGFGGYVWPGGLLGGGVVDAGVIDTGVVDTGVTDTGVVDTGVVDTGVVDTGGTTDIRDRFKDRRTEGQRLFDQRMMGRDATVADIGITRRDPRTGQTITSTGLGLSLIHI